jgi:hypothetical protein
VYTAIILGHKKLETTMRYARIGLDDVNEKVNDVISTLTTLGDKKRDRKRERKRKN